jgi:hypothetical protein
MGSRLFGPLTSSNISVGYIDPDIGFVEGVSICEANEYAKKNPGTVFIFKTGDQVLKYLNINEVNSLTTTETLSTDECEGVNRKVKCGPPRIQIYGGGGIGAVGNAIVGADGSILAVDVIRSGHGYQFNPLVSARDDCDYGSGTILRSVLGDTGDAVVYQYFDRAEDYEEYEMCEPDDIGYGNFWGPNGENLGEWSPNIVTTGLDDPIINEVLRFQRIVRSLEGKAWFTTRKIKPGLIYSNDPAVIASYHQVTDQTFRDRQINDGVKPEDTVGWGPFMNEFAISPKPPSNVRGSDYAGTLFTFEWNVVFPVTGDYIFRGAKDNDAKLYVDNQFISNLDGFRGAINPIKKYFTEGPHNIRIDLVNKPIFETRNIQLYEKQIAGVDFVQKPNGIFMTVGGNIETKVALKLDFDDDPDSAGTAITKIIVPNPDGDDLVIERPKKNGQFVEKGSATGKSTFKISELGYGPIKFSGTRKTPQLSKRNLAYGNNSEKFGKIDFFDARGNDVNGSLSILSSKNLQESRPVKVGPATEITRRTIFNTVEYINRANRKLWRTNVYGRGGFINENGICPFDTTLQLQDNPYAGEHRIVWENIDFPEDAVYDITVAVDDGATIRIGNRNSGGDANDGTGRRDEIILEKEGFDGGERSTGTTVFNQFIRKGRYRIRVDLRQKRGGAFGFQDIKGINPMAFAMDIKSSSVNVEVVSPKSWNENPMGVALVIDSPQPKVPQEPPVVQEGRCPPNPIWTTRSPGSKEQWYPVTFDNRWSKFMKRYAISPIRPLQDEDTDGAGIVYRNSWSLDIPYDGFYGLKGTVDNGGRILIDGEEIISHGRGFSRGSSVGRTLSGFGDNNPPTKKLFLTKGSHTIEVEVENEKIDSFVTIDKKIFSTADWAIPIPSTNKSVNVKFNVSSGAVYSNSISIPELGIDFSKRYNGPQIKEKITKLVEVGKVYEVEIKSPESKDGVRLRGRGSVLEMEEAGDNDWTDIVCAASQGRFFDFKNGRNRATCKFVIDAERVPGLASGTTKDGVKYEGPDVTTYRSGTLGPFLTPTFTSDEDYRANNMGRSWTSTWTNVDFPDDGVYELRTEADDEVIVRIDGAEVGRAKVFQGVRSFSFNSTRGKHTIELEFSNIPGNNNSTFLTNPVVFNAIITRKTEVKTGKGKPWAINPIGISAILISPPCPKRIDGRGIVTDIIVEEPGNGYLAPAPSTDGYPVILKLKEVLVKDPGINYNCGVDQLEITPSNGAQLDYECDTFGRIAKVNILNPGMGFTEYPTIRMPSETGVNATFSPVFEVVRDPVEALTGAIPPEKLIQVTDLVGLKQTGYVDGRAYYGAVFYKEGIRYAGYFETAGQLIQVYDTLQESIDAQVTTPPSAIQRQGTDTNSNNPRLNLPGTPDQLL